MSAQGPRRLRDDPEFLALTGLRFEDEEATASTLDVSAGRANLESTLADGTGTVLGPGDLLTTTTAKVATGLAVVATIAGVSFWPAGQGGPSPAPAVAPTAETRTEAPPVEAAPPAVVKAAPPAVVEVTSPAPAAEPPAPQPTATVSEPASTPPKVRPVRRPPRAVRTREVVTPPEPSSTLPEQLALYDRGKKALASGDHAGAIAAFEAYRERFPTGSLRRENSLSMLEALVRSGRVSRARNLAGRLLSGGGLGKRTAEVRRVLGEMQARLGRCDEAAITLATALHEGAPGLTLSVVEAAVAHCRTKHEGAP